MERALVLARQRNAHLIGNWLGGKLKVEVASDLPERNGFDVVLCDGDTLIRNIEPLRRLREDNAPVLLPVLYMTGRDSMGLRTRDLWEVVDDIVFKPIEKVEFDARMEVLLRTRRLSLKLDQRQRDIGEQLNVIQGELQGALSHLDQVHRSAIEALASALDLRDVETMAHCRRVADLSVRLGRNVGLSEDQLKTLECGALLHDIGKIGMPDGILLKPASLTVEEWSVMKTHPVLGHKLLANIPFLTEAAEIVRHHHESWDGSGYPDGLAGDAIPPGARIFTIIDAYDSMVSDRPYRKALAVHEARQEIEVNSGTQFDPTMVAAFLTLELE